MDDLIKSINLMHEISQELKKNSDSILNFAFSNSEFEYNKIPTNLQKETIFKKDFTFQNSILEKLKFSNVPTISSSDSQNLHQNSKTSSKTKSTQNGFMNLFGLFSSSNQSSLDTFGMPKSTIEKKKLSSSSKHTFPIEHNLLFAPNLNEIRFSALTDLQKKLIAIQQRAERLVKPPILSNQESAINANQENNISPNLDWFSSLFISKTSNRKAIILTVSELIHLEKAFRLFGYVDNEGFPSNAALAYIGSSSHNFSPNPTENFETRETSSVDYLHLRKAYKSSIKSESLNIHNSKDTHIHGSHIDALSFKDQNDVENTSLGSPLISKDPETQNSHKETGTSQFRSSSSFSENSDNLEFTISPIGYSQQLLDSSEISGEYKKATGKSLDTARESAWYLLTSLFANAKSLVIDGSDIPLTNTSAFLSWFPLVQYIQLIDINCKKLIGFSEQCEKRIKVIVLRASTRCLSSNPQLYLDSFFESNIHFKNLVLLDLGFNQKSVLNFLFCKQKQFHEKQKKQLTVLEDNTVAIQINSKLFPIEDRFSNLTRLSLQNCSLLTVPTQLRNFYLLDWIDLSYNKISNVDDIGLILGKITKLDLSWNNLEQVSGISKLVALEFLNVQANLIKSTGSIISLRYMPVLGDIWLSGNPLTFFKDTWKPEIFKAFEVRDIELRINGDLPSPVELKLMMRIPVPAFDLNTKPISILNNAGSAKKVSKSHVFHTKRTTKRPKRVSISGCSLNGDSVNSLGIISEELTNTDGTVLSRSYINEAHNRQSDLSTAENISNLGMMSINDNTVNGDISNNLNDKEIFNSSKLVNVGSPINEKSTELQKKLEFMRMEVGPSWLKVFTELQYQNALDDTVESNRKLSTELLQITSKNLENLPNTPESNSRKGTKDKLASYKNSLKEFSAKNEKTSIDEPESPIPLEKNFESLIQNNKHTRKNTSTPDIDDTVLPEFLFPQKNRVHSKLNRSKTVIEKQISKLNMLDSTKPSKIVYSTTIDEDPIKNEGTKDLKKNFSEVSEKKGSGFNSEKKIDKNTITTEIINTPKNKESGLTENTGAETVNEGIPIENETPELKNVNHREIPTLDVQASWYKIEMNKFNVKNKHENVNNDEKQKNIRNINPGSIDGRIRMVRKSFKTTKFGIYKRKKSLEIGEPNIPKEGRVENSSSFSDKLLVLLEKSDDTDNRKSLNHLIDLSLDDDISCIGQDIIGYFPVSDLVKVQKIEFNGQLENIETETHSFCFEFKSDKYSHPEWLYVRFSSTSKNLNLAQILETDENQNIDSKNEFKNNSETETNEKVEQESTESKDFGFIDENKILETLNDMIESVEKEQICGDSRYKKTTCLSCGWIGISDPAYHLMEDIISGESHESHELKDCEASEDKNRIFSFVKFISSPVCGNCKLKYLVESDESEQSNFTSSKHKRISSSGNDDFLGRKTTKNIVNNNNSAAPYYLNSLDNFSSDKKCLDSTIPSFITSGSFINPSPKALESESLSEEISLNKNDTSLTKLLGTKTQPVEVSMIQNPTNLSLGNALIRCYNNLVKDQSRMVFPPRFNNAKLLKNRNKLDDLPRIGLPLQKLTSSIKLMMDLMVFNEKDEKLVQWASSGILQQKKQLEMKSAKDLTDNPKSSTSKPNENQGQNERKRFSAFLFGSTGNVVNNKTQIDNSRFPNDSTAKDDNLNIGNDSGQSKKPTSFEKVLEPELSEKPAYLALSTLNIYIFAPNQAYWDLVGQSITNDNCEASMENCSKEILNGKDSNILNENTENVASNQGLDSKVAKSNFVANTTNTPNVFSKKSGGTVGKKPKKRALDLALKTIEFNPHLYLDLTQVIPLSKIKKFDVGPNRQYLVLHFDLFSDPSLDVDRLLENDNQIDSSKSFSKSSSSDIDSSVTQVEPIDTSKPVQSQLDSTNLDKTQKAGLWYLPYLPGLSRISQSDSKQDQDPPKDITSNTPDLNDFSAVDDNLPLEVETAGTTILEKYDKQECTESDHKDGSSVESKKKLGKNDTADSNIISKLDDTQPNQDEQYSNIVETSKDIENNFVTESNNSKNLEENPTLQAEKDLENLENLGDYSESVRNLNREKTNAHSLTENDSCTRCNNLVSKRNIEKIINEWKGESLDTGKMHCSIVLMIRDKLICSDWLDNLQEIFYYKYQKYAEQEKSTETETTKIQRKNPNILQPDEVPLPPSKLINHDVEWAMHHLKNQVFLSEKTFSKLQYQSESHASVDGNQTNNLSKKINDEKTKTGCSSSTSGIDDMSNISNTNNVSKSELFYRDIKGKGKVSILNNTSRLIPNFCELDNFCFGDKSGFDLVDGASSKDIVVDKVTYDFLKLYFCVGWLPSYITYLNEQKGSHNSGKVGLKQHETSQCCLPVFGDEGVYKGNSAPIGIFPRTVVATGQFIYLVRERLDVWPPNASNLLEFYKKYQLTKPPTIVSSDPQNYDPVKTMISYLNRTTDTMFSPITFFTNKMSPFQIPQNKFKLLGSDDKTSPETSSSQPKGDVNCNTMENEISAVVESPTVKSVKSKGYIGKAEKENITKNEAGVVGNHNNSRVEFEKLESVFWAADIVRQYDVVERICPILSIDSVTVAIVGSFVLPWDGKNPSFNDHNDHTDKESLDNSYTANTCGYASKGVCLSEILDDKEMNSLYGCSGAGWEALVIIEFDPKHILELSSHKDSFVDTVSNSPKPPPLPQRPSTNNSDVYVKADSNVKDLVEKEGSDTSGQIADNVLNVGKQKDEAMERVKWKLFFSTVSSAVEFSESVLGLVKKVTNGEREITPFQIYNLY
ncbi:hypothetical protein BB559_002957 [Furculomyces boomerangus]|uniref:Uncharacterized protein n=1 Tax=Furculomyces boomerangus TaxID=61424 RepID=A0A2T9YQL5_9FUNG|nr:hypothetical protein BB559_002957 [Furculomyces boomerangus]